MAATSTFSDKILLSHPDIRWVDHTYKVASYAVNFASSLPESVNKLLSKKLIIGLCRWIALLHDLGKTTAYFQEYIRSHQHLKTEHSQHALLSALVTYWITYHWLKKESVEPEQVEILAFLAFMAVRYHHGNLNNPFQAYRIYREQIEILRQQWQSIDFNQLGDFWIENKLPLSIDQIGEFIDTLPRSFSPERRIVRFFRKRTDFRYYFLTNILFSILLDADKSAVGLQEIPSQFSKLPDNLIDTYRSLKGWDNATTDFGNLRNRAYYEAIRTIETKSTGKIFSLQIPTGFGKTLTALSVALKLLNKEKLNRIIYSLPFTSIIDQNYEAIRDVFHTVFNQKIDSTILLKHHHLSDLFYATDDKEYEPLESQLLIEGWHSNVIVTTFIQLFHTLIGFKNRTLRKFHRLANSVIILDEIQSIPPHYWRLLNRIIGEFSVVFNCYFLLVTATEPRLFSFDQKTKLVEPEPYFASINRVDLYPILNQGMDLEAYQEFVLEKSRNQSRTIVVFNTINSAKQFFKTIFPHVKSPYYLSSHLIPRQRLEIIQKLNDEEEFFLVTTQLIEAGVNLDAEVVFRDLGPLDSINQVAGRCNRFARHGKGKVFVVKLLDSRNQRSFASYIYDKSLIDLTQRILNTDIINENLFLQYCNTYFEQISQFPQNKSEQLIESVANLKYDNDDFAISTFRLIEQNYEKYDVFIEVDKIAQKVWQKYVDLKKIDDFWERRAAYLQIKNKFQNYVISIGANDLKRNPPPIVEGIYYVNQNQLDDYYDLITGYKKVSNTSIW